MPARIPASPPSKPQRLARCLIVLSLLLVSGQAIAEERPAKLDSDEYVGGQVFRRAFTGVCRNAARSTIVIRCDGSAVAFGVAVDRDGNVLTKASELRADPVCHFYDKTSSPAKVVAIDRKYDLALLSVDVPNGLEPIEWATDDLREVGRFLVTPDVCELPAAVGVLSVGTLRVPKDSRQGKLGVSEILDGELGPQIKSMSPMSSATRFGFKNGDVIVQVADRIVSDGKSLKNSLRRYNPGDYIFIRILREHTLLTLPVTLDVNTSRMFDRQDVQNRMGGEISIRRSGFDDVIQHDSVLKPHQCGGPLLDLSGKAVGVNIARAGRTESFALPSSTVRDRIEVLKSGRLDVDYALPEEVKARVRSRETETVGASAASE